METMKISDYLKLVNNRVISQQRDHGAVSYIAANNNIPQQTLARHWKRWHDRIRSDGFTDTLIAEINNERRGGHNKAMTNDEELQLDTQLASINHDGHTDFTDRIIKAVAKRLVKRRGHE